MQKFSPCPEPSPESLAFCQPQKLMDSWTSMQLVENKVRDDLDYWTDQFRRAENEGNRGWRTLASGMGGELYHVANRVSDWHESDNITRKNVTQCAVAAWGLSVLCRRLFPSPLQEERHQKTLGGEIQQEALYRDATGSGAANTLLDISPEGDNGAPLAYRLQVPMGGLDRFFDGEQPDPDLPSAQWYENRGLFVQRARPADITLETRQRIDERGAVVDPLQIETLFPYISIGHITASSFAIITS